MIKRIFLSLFALLTVSAFSQDVVGTWETIDDETGKAKSHVKIYKAKNGKIYGKVVKIMDPKKQDATCTKCKGAKKDQPTMGMLIIEGLSPEDDGDFSGGTITDPNKGKVYDCTIWVEDGKLQVRGYWGWIFRTQTWNRVED